MVFLSGWRPFLTAPREHNTFDAASEGIVLNKGGGSSLVLDPDDASSFDRQAEGVRTCARDDRPVLRFQVEHMYEAAGSIDDPLAGHVQTRRCAVRYADVAQFHSVDPVPLDAFPAVGSFDKDGRPP